MRGGVCWDMSSTVVQQGGHPHSIGGYQSNLMMEPHSPTTGWHMHHPILTKQEPMEEGRNDSGVQSAGSDAHSSPGSQHSEEYNITTYSAPNIQNQSSLYYSTPIMPRTSSVVTYHNNMGFNPLTPPSSEPMSSPKSTNYTSPVPIKIENTDENTTLTPRSSPTHLYNENSTTPHSENGGKRDEEDPLRRLQMTFEKNGLLPAPLSPKTSEHSIDGDNRSDIEMEEYDEQGLRIPKVNSHGKVKTFKCKQCDFIAITKLDFWEHSKGHIKTDKLLTCPKCPFVTEYKHHLEYHLRNHFGSKPFKCDKCSYSCVNKSMLNSHMKSHSNVYQYRCADCSYATKYCHSLKLHLRKYSHKPAMVLNIDGTPNPLPIIDVYGTRRGPKQKQHGKQEEIENSPQTIQSSLAQFMLNASPQMQLPFPYPFLGGFPGAFANPLLLQQNLARLANHREAQAELEDRRKEMEENDPSVTDDNISADENVGALDLRKPEINQPPKNRRKGKAFKLDRSAIKHSSSDEDEEEHNVASNHSDASRDSEEDKIQAREKEEEITNNNKPGNYSCQFCCIAFGDVILYTMHMGYHGYKDPFTCNMCGEQCNDKVSFFLHIARTSHS